MTMSLGEKMTVLVKSAEAQAWIHACRLEIGTITEMVELALGADSALRPELSVAVAALTDAAAAFARATDYLSARIETAISD